MISVFEWPDPNTAFDQSKHTLYTCMIFYNLCTFYAVEIRSLEIAYNEETPLYLLMM